MTMVLEAKAARGVPTIPVQGEGTDTADTLEDIIAAHRAALMDLAPHQDERSVRARTGWHMEELGLLLGLRDGHSARRQKGGRPPDTPE